MNNKLIDSRYIKNSFIKEIHFIEIIYMEIELTLLGIKTRT